MADIGAEHVARYRREGAIVVEGLLDDATRRRMKEVLADLVERSREVREHDDVYDLEPAHSARAPRVRRIKRPHKVHPVFDEFMRSPRLLAVLSALGVIPPDFLNRYVVLGELALDGSLMAVAGALPAAIAANGREMGLF